MGETSIQWTQNPDGSPGKTWNPVRGCSVTSAGCAKCYAMQIAGRFSGVGRPFEGFATHRGGHGKWTGKVSLVRDHILDPLRWRKSTRVFVNSMSDLFHENLSDDDIDEVFAVMAVCAMHATKPSHTFQILTKRAARMREYMSAPVSEIRQRLAKRGAPKMEDGDGWWDSLAFQMPWPLPNVWLGVSVESQEFADERIPELLAAPAAVRFVSYEPALEAVDFSRWLFSRDADGERVSRNRAKDGGLDQIIVGGESGRHARPFAMEWAESVVEQCRDAGVSACVKQLGASPTFCDLPVKLKDSHGGEMTEWPEALRVRQFPKGAT